MLACQARNSKASNCAKCVVILELRPYLVGHWSDITSCDTLIREISMAILIRLES